MVKTIKFNGMYVIPLCTKNSEVWVTSKKFWTIVIIGFIASTFIFAVSEFFGMLAIIGLGSYMLHTILSDRDIDLSKCDELEPGPASTNPSTGAPMMGSHDVTGHAWGE